MENVEIAKVLEEVGNLLDLQGENPFRIRAYRNAAETLRTHSERVEDMVEAGKELSKLPGIGKSTASKIKEILETGTCDRLEELREITPSGLLEMTEIPGLGPKKVMAIFKTLEISTVDALKDACENGELAGKVPGMGAKSEAAILAAIETLPEDTGRQPLRSVMPHILAIGDYLEACDAVVRFEVAGSFRRGRETVHDVDFLLEVSDRQAAREAVLAYDDIRQEIAAGQEKVSFRLTDGLQVDFRFVEGEVFGSALMYFTGSKAHNIELRKRAIERGWKLSEYGVFEGEEVLASATEEQVYAQLDLPWIPPELREDRGELMVAEDDELPALVTWDDLRGDFLVRLHDSAGAAEVVEAAQDWEYEFIGLGIASSDEAELVAHLERVADLDDEMDIHVLGVVEVGIGEDGSIDASDEVLAAEWVIGTVRGDYGMSEKEMTARIVTAVESGKIHCLTHPLGRNVDYTARIPVDLDAVLRACADSEVCVLLGGHPHELDTPEVFYRAVRDAGVRLALASEATRAEELWAIELALKTGRRSWARPSDVRNCEL